MYTVYMHEHIYDVVDNQTLINTAWSKFSSSPPTSHTWLKKGLKNISILVRSSTETMVLKFYREENSELTKDEIERNCTFSNHLHEQGLPTPVFVSSQEDEITTVVLGKDDMQYFVVASKFIDGVDQPLKYLSPSELSVFAMSQARFVNAINSNTLSKDTFKKYNIKEEIKRIYNDEVKQSIASYLADNSASQDYISKIINYYTEWGNYFWEEITSNSELIVESNKLVHGDYTTKNVAVNNNKIIAIFDFDNMCMAPEAYDIGRALNSIHEFGLPLSMSIDPYLKSYYGTYSQKMKEACLFHAKYRSFYDFTRFFTYYHSHPGQNAGYTVRMQMLNQMKEVN